jgi:hypothetical protein
MRYPPITVSGGSGAGLTFDIIRDGFRNASFWTTQPDGQSAMAVYSMTGYATAHLGGPATAANAEPARDPKPGLGLEIRSVNSRFLDLTFKLPDDC